MYTYVSSPAKAKVCHLITSAQKDNLACALCSKNILDESELSTKSKSPKGKTETIWEHEHSTSPRESQPQRYAAALQCSRCQTIPFSLKARLPGRGSFLTCKTKMWKSSEHVPSKNRYARVRNPASGRITPCLSEHHEPLQSICGLQLFRKSCGMMASDWWLVMSWLLERGLFPCHQERGLAGQC